jgi:predicted lactoylglutathione lyase
MEAGDKNERQMFVNLPVKNLDETIKFFTTLGFKFNPHFTDENATCMIVGKTNFVMFLVEPMFKGFIPNHELNDPFKSKESLVALTLESREAVDLMIRKAIVAGGKEYRPAEDHGWMYGRAFQDINGHIWEPFFIDMNSMPEQMKNKG